MLQQRTDGPASSISIFLLVYLEFLKLEGGREKKRGLGGGVGGAVRLGRRVEGGFSDL